MPQLEPISTLDMAVLDRNCEYTGIPRRILMENAGRETARVIRERYPPPRNVLVVAGLGDNGGDGIVAARYLHEWGYNVKIVLLGREQDVRSELTLENLRIAKLLGIEVIEITSPLELHVHDILFTTWANIIVDAIIGTGLRGALREPQYSAIRLINISPAVKIAVDVPSGLDPDTGKVTDVAVRADITVTMHRPKLGFTNPEARPYLGEVIVVDIGIPREVEHVVGIGDLLYLNWRRRKESKKGDHGRVVIIGGSEEFSGAPTLAALTAFRLGVDLVTMIVPEAIVHEVRSTSPNIIAHAVEGRYFKLEHVDKVLKYCERAQAVLIGPGIGVRDETGKFVIEIVQKLRAMNKKVVVDADAIKLIAQESRQDLLDRDCVVTAHAGEFKLLVGEVPQSTNIWERGEKVCRTVREKFGDRRPTIVLKGNVDIITDGYRYKLNFTGNPAMTVGGTGDVLAGMVLALTTKTSDVFHAACIAAFLTGLVGDYVARRLGYHILPTDIVDAIPHVTSKLLGEKQEIENVLHIPARKLLDSLSLF